MFNPYKKVEKIDTFYLSRETETPLNTEVKSLNNLAAKCKPDSDWIYNKCMMKSSEYRLMLENNNKGRVWINDPLIKKFPEANAKAKKYVLNSYDSQSFNYNDFSISNPIFNNCSLLYQDHCRHFYERKSLDEKFSIE